MQLDPFLIIGTKPLRDALQKIEYNHFGVIFVTDLNGVVTALATDGDIRRHLLAGGTLDDEVNLCSNSNFVYGKGEPTGTSSILLQEISQ